MYLLTWKIYLHFISCTRRPKYEFMRIYYSYTCKHSPVVCCVQTQPLLLPLHTTCSRHLSRTCPSRRARCPRTSPTFPASSPFRRLVPTCGQAKLIFILALSFLNIYLINGQFCIMHFLVTLLCMTERY